MGTMLLDRADLEVHIDGQALALYHDGERQGTVPLKLLERVIVQGRHIRLDSGVLTRLTGAGASVLLLSPRQPRQIALVLGPLHNEAAVRIAQAGRLSDTAFCAQWSRDLVRAKLNRQLRLLRQALRTRPDARKALTDASHGLSGILRQLEAQDGQEPAIATLRGMEGAGAHAYFGALRSLFPPSLGFSGRNRRPPRDPVNACLSLAYTLLHFDAVRAAHMAGLDPLIGFYHRPAIGRESLACDLIEPLRPRADAWVRELFRTEVLTKAHFTWDGNGCLLGKAGRQHFYSRWETTAPLHRRWLRQRCSRLARTLRDEGAQWLEEADMEEE
ncbi:MAG: CRISPR-associated endonuclease Cas1 [Ectothiorhodospira sp.]